MPTLFDVIVLGVGGMGSATAFELARRGKHVLALEQFPLVHDRGSSHGHTRVIREAYFEHPSYVPLLRRAFGRWFDLEQRTGRHLLTLCGCLNVGPADGELVRGVRASAREHALPIEEFPGHEIGRRFPAMRFDSDMVGLLEQRAGFLYVEECVRAFCDAAMSLGAVIRANEPVIEWRGVGQAVEVTTGKGVYHAANLVVTAGPWASRFLGEVGVPLSLMRQVLLWFSVAEPAQFRRDRLPVYIAETAEGDFYGLPAIDARGHKAAQHYGAPEIPSPEMVDRVVSRQDEEPVRNFFHKHLPGADGPRTAGQTCIYTLTPDRHFVIDTHPGYPQVAFAAGFSGHGFKFASVVGEILADLVEHGKTRHDIRLFRASRFEE